MQENAGEMEARRVGKGRRSQQGQREVKFILRVDNKGEKRGKE